MVATFDLNDVTYEIDHLGIAYDSQWGQFAVYASRAEGGAEQVASFAIPESMLKPEYRPAHLPVTKNELVYLAIETLVRDGRS